MNQESYLKEVEKYLNCRKAQKKQIRRDLEADICAASERGESWEEIRDRMGGPRELAQEFNENMGSGSTGRKMKRSRKILLICGIVAAVLAVLIAVAYWFLPKSYLIENSEIFDAETVAEESEEIVLLLNEDSYEELQEKSTDQMRTVMTEEFMQNAKAQLGGDWGEFQDFTNSISVEVVQQGKHFALTELTALYENRSVTYQISFNENMELSGIYMR